jgi:histone-lysine N-methyltransferase SETMAR
MLEVQRNRAWYDIVTLDESWSYLSTDSEFVWLARDEKFPKENDTQFNRKKFMLAIVWNRRRFHLIKVLQKGRKFNAGYYIAEILDPLSQWRSIEAAGNERKLLVHADNVLPRAAKLSIQYFSENRMKSAPHPPYSPDLAPLDFYLIGYVKRCLGGLSFEDADQLLPVVEGVLECIGKVTSRISPGAPSLVDALRSTRSHGRSRID